MFSTIDQVNTIDNSFNLYSPDLENQIISDFNGHIGRNTSLNGSSITLNTDQKLINIIIDNSGSMSWNDPDNKRSVIAKRFVNKLKNTYVNDPYGIYNKYNLFTFGGKKIKPQIVIGTTSNNPMDKVALLQDCFQNIDAYKDVSNNFAGVRIVRRKERYPQTPADGDIVFQGMANQIIDTSALNDVDYFYKIYTFDKNLKFSKGLQFTVSPSEQDAPVGIDSVDIMSLNGNGCITDSRCLGNWTFNQGQGALSYDFTGYNDFAVDKQSWINSSDSIIGGSGLKMFNSELTIVNDNQRLALVNQMSIFVFIHPFTVLDEQTIVNRGNEYAVKITSDRKIKVSINGNDFQTSSNIINQNEWSHLCITIGSQIKIYLNGILINYFSTPSLATVSDQQFVVGYNYKGFISNLSIFNDIKSDEYIYSRYNDKLLSQYDNGDRLIVGNIYVPDESVFNNKIISVVYNRENIPSHINDGEIIFSKLVNQGEQFYFTHANHALFNQLKNYSVFVSDNNSVSYFTDSFSKSVYSQQLSDYCLSRLTQQFTATVPSVENVSIINGTRKVYIQWKKPNDSEIHQIKIYHSTSEFPQINSLSHTGNLIFAGDAEKGNFLHKDIDDKIIHYYSIVYTNGFNVSSVINKTGLPDFGLDQRLIPLQQVKQLKISNRNIKWENPNINKFVSGYFYDECVFFVKLTDSFGNIINNENISADIQFSYSFFMSDKVGQDVFSGKFTIQPTPNDAFFVSSKGQFIDGILSGSLRPLDSYSFNNYSHGNVQIKIKINLSQNQYFYIENIKYYCFNPSVMNLVNSDKRIVPVKTYTDSSFGSPSVQNITYFDGGFIKSDKKFKITLEIDQLDQDQTVPSFLDIAIYNTQSDIFSNNISPSNLIQKIVSYNFNSESKLYRTQLSVIEKDITDVYGNSTGYTKKITSCDIFVSPPSVPVNYLLYVKTISSGYVLVRKLLIVFRDIVDINIISAVPLSDGISISQQQAIVNIYDKNSFQNKYLNNSVLNNLLVNWKINSDFNFYSTQNSSSVQGYISSYIVNGISKNIYLGPISNIQSNEQIQISATVSYNGSVNTVSKKIIVQPLYNNISKNNRFLMYFDNFKNNIYSDGQSYLRLRIQHNPGVLTGGLYDVFNNYLASLSQTNYQLSQGMAVNMYANDNDVEIIYGATQSVDLNGKDILDTTNATSSFGQITVPLSNESYTYVYFRYNKFIENQKVNGVVKKSLNPAFGEQIDNELYYNKQIIVTGQISILAGSENILLIGGGDLNNGIPPTIIIPKQPLNISLVGKLNNGNYLQGIINDGTSINDLIFQVSFSGYKIPNSQILINYENFTQNLILGSNSVDSNNSVISALSSQQKSYITLPLNPISNKSPYKSNIILNCKYSNSSNIERNYITKVSVSNTTNNYLSNQIQIKLFQNKMLSYDVLSNTFAQCSSMKTNRGGHKIFYYNNKIYAIGGINSSSILRTVQCYDILSDTWQYVQPMINQRYNFQANIIGDKIYVFGGLFFDKISRSIKIRQEVQVYDISLNSWTAKEDMPSIDTGKSTLDRYGISMGVSQVNGTDIYVLSGIKKITQDGSYVIYNDRVLTYNTLTNQWSYSSVINNEIYKVSKANSFISGTDIYVFNGLTEDKLYNTCNSCNSYSLDINTGIIYQQNHNFIIPKKVSGSSSVMDGNNLYILGGASSNFTNVLNKIDISTQPYQVNYINEFNKSFSDSACCFYGDKIYFSGGFISGVDIKSAIIEASIFEQNLLLDGLDHLTIKVDIKKQNYQFITESVSVKIKAYIQQANSISLDYNLLQYGVRVLSQQKTTSSGTTTFTLNPRSDDVLSKLTFSEIRNKILIQIIVSNDNYYGQTLINANKENIVSQISSSVLTANFYNSKIYPIVPYNNYQQQSKSVNCICKDIWVSSINNVLINETADEVISKIQQLQYQTPFGGSPLFDSVVNASKYSNDQQFDSMNKYNYIFTDNQQNSSLGNIQQSIIQCGQITNIISEVMLVNKNQPISGKPYHLQKMAEQTFGSVNTFNDVVQIDDFIDVLIQKSDGGLGHGFSTFIYDLQKQVLVDSILVNYSLPSNTSGKWRYSLSNNNLVFQNFSKFNYPTQTVSDINSKARYIKFQFHLMSGFSIDNTQANQDQSTDYPSVDSVQVIYINPKEDFIYSNAVDTLFNVQQASVAVMSDSTNIQVGIQSSNTSFWEDYNSSSQIASKPSGRSVIVNRSGVLNGNKIQPLIYNDGYLYYAIYGQWHPQSNVQISSFDGTNYNIIDSNEYNINPRQGIVMFKTRQGKNIFITIKNKNKIKLGIKITNSDITKNIKIFGAGAIYANSKRSVN